jgi:hypothetical protein
MAEGADSGVEIWVFIAQGEQRMCLGTFSRLRRSLATSTLYAAVRILAERFYFTGKQFPVK